MTFFIAYPFFAAFVVVSEKDDVEAINLFSNGSGCVFNHITIVDATSPSCMKETDNEVWFFFSNSVNPTSGTFNRIFKAYAMP